MVSLVNECWQKHHVFGVACEGYSVWSTDSNITFVVLLVNECGQTHHVCGVASEGYSIWSKCMYVCVSVADFCQTAQQFFQ